MDVRRIAVLLLLALVLAACGGEAESQDAAAEESEPAATTDTSSPAAEPSPTEEPTTAEEPTEAGTDAASEAGTDAASGTVAVADSDLGEILVDGEGATLYVFDNDTDGTSTCYDDCASNWPPLTGEATAGEGVDESLLGTTERDDGTVQVTYADSPLYYFAGDQAAGDVNGQGVGDVWWVVGPDGEAIQEAATASAAQY